jgi:hypothetical protein
MSVVIGMKFESAAVRHRNSAGRSDFSRSNRRFPSTRRKDGLAGSRRAGTYFFTSGQVDCDKGWKASSAGMVATSL